MKKGSVYKMQQASLEQLKEVQLNILRYVADFCEKNQINYWLDGGTLIGAVRHKGYIPWDDDIDLGMLREDYDRFSQLFRKQEADSQYKFKSASVTPGFYIPYGKVVDETTLMYEPDEKGEKSSIYIDIFVYDNVPADKKIQTRLFWQQDFWRKMDAVQVKTQPAQGNVLRRGAIRMLHFFLLLWPRHFFLKKVAENAKKYNHCQTEYVGNFTDPMQFVCNKRVFDSFIEAEFEGKIFKIPVGYDEWLRTIYGDYMELPPVEQRVTHHSFIAYIK